MATKISIAFLDDAHVEALKGAELGDYLQLVRRHVAAVSESESGSDDEFYDESEDEESEESVRLENVEVADEVARSAQGGDSGSGSDGENAANELAPTTIFVVANFATGLKGEIEEIDVLELPYALLPGQDGFAQHSYQIYGSEISAMTSEPTCPCCETLSRQIKPLTQLNEQYGLANYDIRLKPTGADLRSVVMVGGHCRAGCDDGFLNDIEEIKRVLHPGVYETDAVLPHCPVCPVCMGLPLLVEQQTLRTTLDATSCVNFADAVEFTGRLNERRAELGYEFMQFDEREWGFMFDDMLSDEEDEDEDDDFERLGAEAMDPNGGYQGMPADPDAVAALPRKELAEVVDPALKGEVCIVCLEDYKPKEVVVSLPCMHVLHDHCITPWLGTSHKCPNCRGKLPVAQENEAGAERNDEGDRNPVAALTASIADTNLNA